MSGRYAEGTSVQPESSQQEISGLLRRYGADGFAYGWEAGKAMVTFRAHDRTVRFVLTIPTDPKDFARTPKNQVRTSAQQQSAMEAEVRRLWRCLCLAIKAKLEVVESGIATFEDEFLAHIVLPDGTNVGDRIKPEIEQAYRGLPSRSLLALDAGGDRG
jgi:hypothetical protein